MPLNDLIRRFRVVYSRDPLRKHLIIRDDGSIFNSVTGELFNIGDVAANISAAERAELAKPISSIRQVFPTGIVEGGSGAAALESRVAVVNKFLRTATPEELRTLKLDKLIGKQVIGMQATFAIQNNEQILESILDPGSLISRNFPGITNITGEGLIRVGFRIAGEETPLSELEQLILLNKLDANYLTNNVITDFFHQVVASQSDDTVLKKISELVGKVPKRLQSELAPRDVSFSTIKVDAALVNMGNPAGVDNIGKSLELTDITDIVLKKIRGDELTPAELRVVKSNKRIFGTGEDVMQFVGRVSGLIGADPTQNLDPNDVYGLLSEQIRSRKIDPKSGSIFKQLKKTIETVTADARRLADPDKIRQAEQYKKVVESLADNLEPMRDGSVLMTESFVRKLIGIKSQEHRNMLKDLKSSGLGTVNEEQLDRLRALEGEIKKLKQILRSGTTADNTVRFPVGEGITLPDGRKFFPDEETKLGGTIKAKAAVLRFENYEGNYRNLPYKEAKKEVERIRKRKAELRSQSPPLLPFQEYELELLESDNLPDVLEQFERTSIIGDISAVKKETGKVPFVEMNVAMRSSEHVYVEPMELMAEPTLFTSESFLKAQQSQLAKTEEGIRAFAETGKLPGGQSLISFIEQQRADLAGLSFDDLNPAAKGLALQRRKYLAEIDNVMKLGLPLEKTEAMLNLITSHFSTQVFTTKDGVPRMVVPSATRYGIRTSTALMRDSSIFSEGGHTLIPILTRKNKIEKAAFVEFELDGDLLIVSDENASVYKSVLSGFDQDDDVITQLRTFKDENGKMRFGTRIVRDPKSREESIFARPRFDSITTLQGLLNKDPETITKLQTMMEDGSFLNQIMAETGIDEPTAKNVFDKLKKVLAQKDGQFVYKSGRVSGVDESSLFAIETIVRIAKEMERGAPLESFQDAAEVDAFEKAASMRTASVRARNAVVLDSEGRPVTQQALRGLSPEQAGPYLDQRMIQIQTEVAIDPNKIAKVLKHINNNLAQLGDPPITADELKAFLSTNLRGMPEAVIRAVSEQSILGIVQDTARAVHAGEVAETIGALANAAAGVESVSDILQDAKTFTTLVDSMSKEAMTTLEGRLGEIKVPVEPRSNIVDIINQSMGNKALQSYTDRIKGIPEAEHESVKKVYEAIAKQVHERTGIPTTYLDIHNNVKYLQSDAAKAAISQQSQALSLLRAYQLAAGVEEQDLVGFDPMVLSNRFKSVKEQIRKAAIDAYKSALANFAGNEEAQKRIKKELDELEKSKDALNRLGLQKGSRLYKKYAATSVQADLALEAEAKIALVKLAYKKAQRKNIPIAKAEYIKSARKMIRASGISESLKELKKLAQDPLRAAEYRVRKLEISEKLAKGLRAIQANYESSSSTTLDIVDAIESELRTQFSDAAARLLGGPGEPGFEHEMMSLFEAAQTRRLAETAKENPISFGLLQRAFREHTGDPDAAIDSVDEDYAKRFLEYQSSEKISPTERARSQHLLDFMQIKAAKDHEARYELFQTLKEQGRTAAQEAYSFIAGERGGKELGEKTATLIARGVGPEDLEDIGSLADDIARSVTAGEDELFEVSRSNYKRMSFDVFKSKNVRTGTIAAAALIGASFLYQSKKKKDHTAADIQGPPLLPGGNPYETGYPTRQQIISQMEQNAGQTYGRGMQYQINTTGSIQDLNKLRGMFGDVVDGPINSTMYNGLPIMGQDPYSDIASRF